MNRPEARYRLRYDEVFLGHKRLDGLFATARCGCQGGSCGDELATLILWNVERPWVWDVWVKRGYSQRPPGSGVWMWSRHARRSRRGAPDHAPALGSGTVTRQGDVVLGRALDRGGAGFVADRKRIAFLRSPANTDEAPRFVRGFRSEELFGVWITMGCQQAIPHLSVITYDAVMRQARDERLVS